MIRARELYGYEAHSGDQLVGRPVDLMFDIEDLSIRYLILDLTPGRQEESKKLLLPLPWILRVEREAGRLLLRLPAEAVAHAPEYRPGEPITHAYEKNLVLHYNSLEHKV